MRADEARTIGGLLAGKSSAKDKATTAEADAERVRGVLPGLAVLVLAALLVGIVSGYVIGAQKH